MNKTPDWDTARNILAVRADNMGDVLMTTPALRALHELPGCRQLTLLTSPAGSGIAAMIPEIDNVIVSASLPWMPGSNSNDADNTDNSKISNVRSYASLVETLKAGAFDAAVIFTVYSQSPLPAAMLCWQAGIPLRLAHCRENPYSLLTHWIPDPEPHETMRHEVRRQLDLVESVGAIADNERLSLDVNATDTIAVMEKLECHGIDIHAPWLMVHPGASAPSRRYPAAHYIKALRELVALDGCQIVITGGPEEAGLARAIADEIAETTSPVASLAGHLSLGELVALTSMASTLVSNNTGPVHIAAAVGTPVVDIYALTNPQHAPWKVPNHVLFHDVPCRFCYRSTCPQTHHDCLNLLDPSRVAAAARDLLQLGAERSTPERSPIT